MFITFTTLSCPEYYSHLCLGVGWSVSHLHHILKEKKKKNARGVFCVFTNNFCFVRHIPGVVLTSIHVILSYLLSSEHPPSPEASDQRTNHHRHCPSTLHCCGRGRDSGVAEWLRGGAGSPLRADGQPSQCLPWTVAQAERGARCEGCGRWSWGERGRVCDWWEEFNTPLPLRMNVL